MISFSDLQIVNTKGNLFPYKTEVAEDWTPEGDEKDCDSYMSWKLWVLVHKYGWPERSLRPATCFVPPYRDENGLWVPKINRGHAILLVDYEGKTYALDNCYPHPMEHYLLPYEWHKIWNHDMIAPDGSVGAWEWAEGADRSFE